MRNFAMVTMLAAVAFLAAVTLTAEHENTVTANLPATTIVAEHNGEAVYYIHEQPATGDLSEVTVFATRCESPVQIADAEGPHAEI